MDHLDHLDHPPHPPHPPHPAHPAHLDRSMERAYRVVVDEAGHYSVWAEGRAAPPGWRATGVTGSKRYCLDQVTRAWLDPSAEPFAPRR